MQERLYSRPALQRKENQARKPKRPVSGARTPMSWHDRMIALGRREPTNDHQAPVAQMMEEEEAAQSKSQSESIQMMEEEEAAQAKSQSESIQMMEEEEAAQAKTEEESAQMMEEEEAAQAKTEEASAQMMEEEEAAQSKSQSESIQMMEEEEAAQAKTEEESAQMKEEEEAGQMKAGKSSQKGDKGRKTKLPSHVQAKMENGLGADFSGVNIHENSEKVTQLGALAYAKGNDIYLAPGQYQPESKKGQALLGHELQHVVQQREGRVKPTSKRNGLGVNTDHGLEREADIKGKAAAEGKPASNAYDH